MPIFTTGQLAEKLNGQVIGDPALPLSGFAPADSAKTGELTFAENETYFARADQSAAAAILVAGPFTSTNGKTLIQVANARVAFAQVLPLFFPSPCLRRECTRPRSWPPRRRWIPPRTSARNASWVNG